MRIMIIVATVFILLLAGLFMYFFHEINSVNKTIVSAGLFFKYLAGIGIIGILFLLIDFSIGLKNIPGYFKRGTARNLLLLAVFMMILILPVTGLIMGMESNFPNYEKRPLAEKPSLTARLITSFPNEFDIYFNDNFGFRKTWIFINNYVKVTLPR